MKRPRTSKASLNANIQSALLLTDERLRYNVFRMTRRAQHKFEMFMLVLSFLVWWIVTKLAFIHNKYRDFIAFLDRGAACKVIEDKEYKYKYALAIPGSITSGYGPKTLFPNSAPIPFWWPPGPILPSYIGSSSFWLALAVEYPVMSMFKFQNSSFPLAVYKAFKSSCFMCVMSKVDGPHAGATHIPVMFQMSQMCSFQPSARFQI